MNSLKNGKSSIGVDLGGTKIKTVALLYPDEIICEYKVDSRAHEGPKAVRSALIDAITYYLKMGIEFESIGIGCAGSITPSTGVVTRSPNFLNFENVPLKEWIMEDFGYPTCVANDANCAAVTEWKMGNAKYARNAVLLTFGTGIGGGLILDGKLYSGSTGTGGELGHFSIKADGIACSCGNTGCFERFCSSSALSLKHPGFSAKEIFALAQKKEEPFYSTVCDFIKYLKIGLTSIANIFDPDCILVGGGLSKGLLPYFPEIQEWITSHAFPGVAEHTKITPTKFFNQSGAIGAAILAFDLL